MRLAGPVAAGRSRCVRPILPSVRPETITSACRERPLWRSASWEWRFSRSGRLRRPETPRRAFPTDWSECGSYSPPSPSAVRSATALRASGLTSVVPAMYPFGYSSASGGYPRFTRAGESADAKPQSAGILELVVAAWAARGGRFCIEKAPIPAGQDRDPILSAYCRSAGRIGTLRAICQPGH